MSWNSFLLQKLKDMVCHAVVDSTLPDNRTLLLPVNFGKEDNACAMENIFLAAHSLGVGSVWINQLNGISDRLAVREVLTELSVPADHVVYGMAALGYPDETEIGSMNRRLNNLLYILLRDRLAQKASNTSSRQNRL